MRRWLRAEGGLQTLEWVAIGRVILVLLGVMALGLRIHWEGTRRI